MPGRGVSLRKLKSSNTRLAFGTLLNGPASPEWRFKLLAQYHLKVSGVLALSLLVGPSVVYGLLPCRVLCPTQVRVQHFM
jgi:hypothetical protein